jgi:hypothetical protein
MRRAGTVLAHVIGAALLVHGCARDEPVDVGERVRELKALGPRGAEAVPILLEALSDRDARVRHAAAVALTYADPTQTDGVHVLAAGLESEDWYTRWESCLALKRIGPPARAAVQRLRKALCNPESGIVRESALALVHIAPNDVEVADTLLRVLRDERTVDRSALTWALRRISVPVPATATAEHDTGSDRAEVRAAGKGHYYNGEYDDHYDPAYDEAEAEVEPWLDDGLPQFDSAADRLASLRSRMCWILHEAGARDLAAILREQPDAFFGFLPAGFAPREREVYRKLRAQLERDLLPAATVRALGEAVWQPRHFGSAILEYGDAEARAFAAALLGHVEFDYFRAKEALRRAGLDPAPIVRAAARAARARIEARRLTSAAPEARQPRARAEGRDPARGSRDR